jgi:hypothetical protein
LKNKIKIIIALFLIIITLVFLIFRLQRREYNSETMNVIYQPDLTKILQYGDKLETVRITDRYGNIFDIDDYKNKPILFLFCNANNEHIIKFNDTLKSNIDKYIKTGLQIIYVTTNKNQENTLIKMNSKEKIFYDTDELLFFNQFKISRGCGSTILINKNKTILLSTLTLLPIDIIEEIINNKKDILF